MTSRSASFGQIKKTNTQYTFYFSVRMCKMLIVDEIVPTFKIVIKCSLQNQEMLETAQPVLRTFSSMFACALNFRDNFPSA